jgi:hydroxyacylglutathione hydrolase
MPQKGRVPFKTETANPGAPEIRDIDPSELAQKAALVTIVDVRGEDEYEGELGHIAGSRLIVLPSLAGRAHELPKDETVVFVCKSGGRSARAAALALKAGVANAYNMRGGMLRWNELGLPVER